MLGRLNLVRRLLGIDGVCLGGIDRIDTTRCGGISDGEVREDERGRKEE